MRHRTGQKENTCTSFERCGEGGPAEGERDKRRGKVGGKRRKEKKARKTNYCWSSDAWRVRLVGGYVVEWLLLLFRLTFKFKYI